MVAVFHDPLTLATPAGAAASGRGLVSTEGLKLAEAPSLARAREAQDGLVTHI